MATPPVNANAGDRAPKGGNDRRERRGRDGGPEKEKSLSLIHISEPTRPY